MDRRESKPPLPRFILFTPAIGETGQWMQLLATCCESADIATVILRTASANDEQILSATNSLAPAVQASGAAFLLENHAALAAKSGADGAHLTNPEIFPSAVALLKPAGIVGAAGLLTRHDAMTAGEMGADYVMFGDPSGDKRPAFEFTIERVKWWAEIFEVPCVAFATELDEIPALVDAGADFIALGDAIWNHSDGPVAALKQATMNIRREPVT